MSHSFLFIIPLTPQSKLTPVRKELQDLCISMLKSQNYSNWKVLLVGAHPIESKDDRFIHVNYEGPKEEKLQVATQYIIDNKLACDYLIRLDDDDVFNPGLLADISAREFDFYSDKYHTFFLYESGQTAQRIMYWYPNTCIHKREHALKPFGSFPKGDFKKFRPAPLLIENEHNNFHHYYNQTHKLLFANADNPVYVRIINRDSVTSIISKHDEKYLFQFGYWRNRSFAAFKPMHELNPGHTKIRIKQGLTGLIEHFINNLRANRSFNKLVILK